MLETFFIGELYFTACPKVENIVIFLDKSILLHYFISEKPSESLDNSLGNHLG